MKKFRKKINLKRSLRTNRTRSKILGTSSRPRAAIFRSARHISVQLIDDGAGKTLAAASDLELKKDQQKLTGVKKAVEVGKLIARKAIKAKIKQVVFDRRSYKYHGRVKMVAESMRENGLEF